MAEEAKITDAPVGADLASMDVASISTVVDTVQEKVTQAKNQIAALPPRKTSAMADALVKAEATATRQKSRPKKPRRQFPQKLLPRSERGSEEALQAAKEAKAFKDEAEALVDFKEIVREADASIAEEALSAYEAFAEAELAVEQAATAIASADSSQELALDYVSGVLSQKRMRSPMGRAMDLREQLLSLKMDLYPIRPRPISLLVNLCLWHQPMVLALMIPSLSQSLSTMQLQLLNLMRKLVIRWAMLKLLSRPQ